MNKLLTYRVLALFAFLSMIYTSSVHAEAKTATVEENKEIEPSTEQNNAKKGSDNVSYVQISSYITQTPTSGVGSSVKMEIVDAMKGFEHSSDKRKLICKQKGLYFAIASGQVGAANPGALGYVDCWFMKNGESLSNSNNRQTINSSSYTGCLISQFIMDLDVGDSLEVVFSASGPSLGFIYIKPDNEPGIPSFTLSMNQIQ
ncbi:MAG: hypothetical protein HKM07_05620 [Chlamydiae bacterium]|nr:hypothetical protein [Chlamydiota bacterium]